MVYVFFAEGFEEVEALTVVDVLRRAQIETLMVGLNKSSVTGSHDISVQMDLQLEEIENLDEVEMLVLPGGMPGAKHLAENDDLKKLLNDALGADLHLAAICAAPTVLSKHGLIKGRQFTCYPGFENQIEDGVHTDAMVVHDGKLITGKGVGAALQFALKLVEIIKGEDVSKALAKSMICL
ncbi:MAG TPA: DJ-1 family protein [Clostridiales bacterium UBA8960]|nr:DJ-1 family protein [Clostridiales bacterium UBA8960]